MDLRARDCVVGDVLPHNLTIDNVVAVDRVGGIGTDTAERNEQRNKRDDVRERKPCTKLGEHGKQPPRSPDTDAASLAENRIHDRRFRATADGCTFRPWWPCCAGVARTASRWKPTPAGRDD